MRKKPVDIDSNLLTYASYVGVPGGRPVHWSKIKANDVVRWNKATVLRYAQARGVRVDVTSPKTLQIVGRKTPTICIGVGVGLSYRAALLDLLTYEEYEKRRGHQ